MCKEKNPEKGEKNMNASAMKPNIPYVTRSELKRTPASMDNIRMVEFLDSHDFSFSVIKDSKKLRSSITPKSNLWIL